MYFPDNDDFDNFDFSANGYGIAPNRVGFMREIIGYAPVHPDGSVRVQVPADVPLSFEIVDENAQRINIPGIGQEYNHPTWIVVHRNEEVTCHGCHNRADDTYPHGRKLIPEPPLSAAFNPGAPSNAGFGYPNIVELAGMVAVNDTMAEALTKQMEERLPVSPDVVYNDDWTNSGNSFTYSFDSLPTILLGDPRDNCVATFNPNCRVEYKYASHIQPMWEAARTFGGQSVQCIRCHTNANLTQVPFGQRQIDLTQDGTGDPVNNAFYFKSYEELMSSDNKMIDMGGIMDETPVVTTFAPVINAGTARNSAAFFRIFTEDYYNNEAAGTACDPDVVAADPVNRLTDICAHWDPGNNQGWLTPDELRVLSEWIDNGAQYVNNPFDSPQ